MCIPQTVKTEKRNYRETKPAFHVQVCSHFNPKT